MILYHLSGQLRLELPKEIYERTGLTGKPIRDAGRKHVKTRFGKYDPSRMSCSEAWAHGPH